jgi:periplasmic protein TonB
MKIKELLIISLLQFIGITAFSQTADSDIVPKFEHISLKESIAMSLVVTESGDTIYEMIDESAEFPGGTKALLQFIREHLKYPERALKESIEGRCSVKLLISEMGEVKKVQISRGIEDCPECDAEAMRIMYLMPKWKPGKVNGKNVSSYYRIPVTFKLS